ncbi:MAG: hypothetical protein PF448_13040 [Bacteroidales bacterium]|jgi:hypothetical protein|nr:hypothetical protein [Bacteroidales bacterium]
MVLYNDRVNSYYSAKELDAIIDSDPTFENLNKLVTLDERNRLSHLELQHYEQHSEFLYKHPLLQDDKLRNELNTLRRTDPEAFMQMLTNAKKSIDRYRSQLNNKRYSTKEERMQKEQHIRYYTHKIAIIKELVAQA